MELVSLIDIEDDPPPYLSFAVWQPELDGTRNIILMRYQDVESLFDESERGVNVSDEAWLDEEDDMLNQIEYGDNLVKITTNYHQIELDLKKVDQEKIWQTKDILQKMNFDNNFETRIA